MDSLNEVNDHPDEMVTYTTVHVFPETCSDHRPLQPKPHTNNNENDCKSNNSKEQRKKQCLEFLKELVKNKDLQEDDVEGVLSMRRNELASKDHSSVQIKSEDDVIVITDEEDVTLDEKKLLDLMSKEQIKAEFPPDVATITADSGLPSSCYSSVCRDWLDSSESELNDVFYAESVKDVDAADSDYYQEEFWEPPEIAVGNVYLVPSEAGCWTMAKLIKKSSETHFKLLLLQTHKTVKVSRRLIASAVPTDTYIRVGGRVVAALRTFVDTGELKGRRGRYTLGVIGEDPRGYNDFRYLVIFDNGYWLYVKPQMVRPIFNTRKRVWKLVPKGRRREVKDFLKGEFRPVRTFERGQLVSVREENSNDILYGDVMAVDSSLVLVRYQTVKKIEWIHRGCQRLQLVN